MQKGSRRDTKQAAVAEPMPNSSPWERWEQREHVLGTPHFCTTSLRLEATGSCLHDSHQTNHLKRPNGWGQGGGMRLTFKSFIWSVSSLPRQYESAKAFACSLYRKGVELEPQFWPMMLPINRNFILLNFCLIETTRTRKELPW